ncbi:MAG: hypothetical protein HYX96_02480 [Chloroflexi bacterium]|nr:hypothetical protein [Chloroflexota bacterium]
MENIIISIVSLALLIVGGMTMSQGFISTVDTSQSGWQHRDSREQSIMRTQVSPLSAAYNRGQYILDVTLENSGQTKLNDFSRWDVIIQYYDTSNNYQVKWLPYTAGTPGNNQWTVEGIYLNDAAEVFDINILNPGEQIKLRAKLSPQVKAGSTNVVIIATPNGVAASAFFSGS